MKDLKYKLTVDGKDYFLIFDLNVMEQIQEEYKTIAKWGELTDKSNRNGEINLKALIFGITAMINEGIEITNEEKNENNSLLTHKQVGRIITKLGIDECSNLLNDAVVDGVKSDEKN